MRKDTGNINKFNLERQEVKEFDDSVDGFITYPPSSMFDHDIITIHGNPKKIIRQEMYVKRDDKKFIGEGWAYKYIIL